MTEKTRIVANTLATYARSLVALMLGLFSTRWILNGLGQTDFGLYGVVGSIIVFITFLNTTLAGSMSRFFAYSIGHMKVVSETEGKEDLQRWFNIALCIHCILPTCLVAVGLPIGRYAIEHWLVIPPERLNSCLMVFDMALVAAFISMVSVPFTAMFQAYQYIFELSLLGVVNTGVMFTLAYTLLSVQGDRLVYYAKCLMLINVTFSLIQCVWATLRFKVCRIRLRYWFDAARFKEFLSFGGSKIFGAICVLFRTQGGALLLNQFFVPNINAAYSVSMQVSAHTASLSQSLIGAMQPAIATREGGMDRPGMLRMAESVCRIASCLVVLFCVPLTIELGWVLNAWLHSPPPYALPFCACMLVMLVFDKMSVGYMLAANAYGKKIIVYELVNGCLLVAALPMAYVCFKCDLSPYALVICLCITMIAYSCARVGFCRWQLGVSIKGWVGKVVLPVLLVVGLASLAAYIVKFLMPSSFIRVACVSVASSFVTVLGGYLLLLNEYERGLVNKAFERILKRR